ncbi:hypothetical protein [Leifsonia sp. Le1]|uniref:hypothetical protein n=1 Tax=Leifsonia sp. Le1 TaxID=3404918 RepID=UPI003EB92957
MTPEEAASVLGVPLTATADDVDRVYTWRVGSLGPGDTARREALTQARAVLLRGPSRPRTGAIVAWSLGGVLGVMALLAVVAVVTTSVFGLGPGGAAAPQRSGEPAPLNSSAYDGVSVQYAGDGWSFILTSPRDCPAAKVVVGFADAPGQDTIDQLTDTAPLQAGVPYTYTAPDGASVHQYAHIDEIVCHAM